MEDNYKRKETMNPLEDCPFCGSRAIVTCANEDMKDMEQKVDLDTDAIFAQCTGCGAESEYYQDVEEVLAVWNSRVARSTEVYILNCPFCGGRPKLETNAEFIVLICQDCSIHSRYEDTVDEAIKSWNIRE